MKKPAKAPVRKWHLFGKRITISRNPVYGTHVQMGRWVVGRETRKFSEATRTSKLSASKEKDQ